MRPPIALAVLLILTAVLACNLPNATPQPTAPNESPTIATSPTVAATLTETPVPLPTGTTTPNPTATPSTPMLTPSEDPVNCRLGPGTEWIAIGALLVGEVAPIQGKSASGSWWYIQILGGINCWAAASVTIASGNLSPVSVQAPPTAEVTDVTIKVEPSEVVVPGCVFPGPSVDFKGSITTNGPTTVTWHWETSKGDTSADSTLNFNQYDTKNIQEPYRTSAEGEHWVELVVTSPNKEEIRATYTVKCGP